MTNKIMPKVNREGRRSFLQKSIAVVATGVVTHAFSAPNITLEKDTKPQPGTCILSVEQMAGPYIKSNMPIRRNIAENENGVPLLLKITVIDSNSCRPLEYYYVDIWQCNARGRIRDGVMLTLIKTHQVEKLRVSTELMRKVF